MSSLEENLEKPLIPFWKCQAWKAILWPQSNSCAVHLLLTGCLSLSSLCLVLTPFLQACPFPPSPRAALGGPNNRPHCPLESVGRPQSLTQGSSASSSACCFLSPEYWAFCFHVLSCSRPSAPPRLSYLLAYVPHLDNLAVEH